MFWLLILGSLPVALALFAIGYRAGLLNGRVVIEPNDRAAAAGRERITR